jgi:hypothetical protein
VLQLDSALPSEGRGHRFGQITDAAKDDEHIEESILSGTRFSSYNLAMQDPRNIVASSAGHDGSLLDWFSTLSAEQRLAELESRVSFFLSYDDNRQISSSETRGIGETEASD